MVTISLFYLIAFIFGICVGSFMNVCIYRLPNSKSIVKPNSHCPQCLTPIKFYDNIPLLSYIFLQGKCRKCKLIIPFRYPLVEFLSGICAVAVLIRYGISYESIIYYIFIASLIVIIFIDIDHQIIPDIITLPGILIFFLASLLMPSIKLLDSIIGILLGGGSLLIIAQVYYLLTKKEGMGGGDIKLLAMIGSLIGWQGVLFTIFFSSLIGTVIGLIEMGRLKKNMKLKIPFGPFLSMAAILYIFHGNYLISWYINLLK
ncbi:MAG: prepilin peptidase [Desulfobacterales bacterium]|nr:prepilin peptidase [Desulfobacterales bacterium]